MDSARQRFLGALDVDRASLSEHLEALITDLEWEDPLGELRGVEPGDLLLCSTFGETLAHTVEIQLGRFTLRYPGPVQHRAATLLLVDGSMGIQGRIDDLGKALGPRDPDLAKALRMTAAQARQPDGSFRWEHDCVNQATRVVSEVEHWPGQIELEAARRYDPELRIGDHLWLEDSDAVSVSWVLDWLRAG